MFAISHLQMKVMLSKRPVSAGSLSPKEEHIPQSQQRLSVPHDSLHKDDEPSSPQGHQRATSISRAGPMSDSIPLDCDHSRKTLACGQCQAGRYMTWVAQQGSFRGNGLTPAPPAQYNLQISNSASPCSRQASGRRSERPKMGEALNSPPTAPRSWGSRWRPRNGHHTNGSAPSRGSRSPTAQLMLPPHNLSAKLAAPLLQPCPTLAHHSLGKGLCHG